MGKVVNFDGISSEGLKEISSDIWIKNYLSVVKKLERFFAAMSNDKNKMLFVGTKKGQLWFFGKAAENPFTLKNAI